MSAALIAGLIHGLAIQPIGRAALIRGAAAAAATATLPPAFAEEKFVAKRAQDVAELKGSGGLSSYNSMKLNSALKDLAEAPVAADIKPSVDVISAALPLIMEEKVPDSAKVAAATDALANLVLTPNLQERATSINKQSAGIKAAIARTDANAAAIAATALADELTDFCYSYEGAQKPLAELRNGAPPAYDKSKVAIELPVSGKSL